MESETKTQPEEGPRSFSRLLEQLGDGAAHAELSKLLNALCAKMRDEAEAQQKEAKGELTLKLSLVTEPDTKVFAVQYEIKAKEPAPKRPTSMFFVTRGGNLTVENPRQHRLPLREVKNETTEARDVEGDEGAREV